MHILLSKSHYEKIIVQWTQLGKLLQLPEKCRIIECQIRSAESKIDFLTKIDQIIEDSLTNKDLPKNEQVRSNSPTPSNCQDPPNATDFLSPHVSVAAPVDQDFGGHTGNPTAGFQNYNY